MAERNQMTSNVRRGCVRPSKALYHAFFIIALLIAPGFSSADARLGSGDMNCDGALSVPDIGPFVLALTDPPQYMLQFPDCELLNADMNGNGTVNVADVASFVTALLSQTGVVNTIPTAGFAQDLVIRGNIMIVSEAAAGVSIFDVSHALEPRPLANVDTPGTALDADVENEMIVVADGASGCAFIRLSQSEQAVLERQIPLLADGQARTIAIRNGTVYVGDSRGRVHAIEVSTGVVLGSLMLQASSAVDDLEVAGDILLALTTANSGTGGTLFALQITNGLPTILGQVGAPHSNERAGPYPRRRLFAGLDRALVSTFGGFSAFDFSNPAAMTLICSDNGLVAARGLVETGSGSIIVAGGSSLDSDCQLYAAFPTSCSTLQAAFPTPGNAHGVCFSLGAAYVADGESGVQVVRVQAADIAGQPPTGTLVLTPAGPIVLEGMQIRVVADVSDDTQINDVIFFVNDTLIHIDRNFPFEARWRVPVGAAPDLVFTAVARDIGGNVLTLAAESLAVAADTDPPTISIQTPVGNTTFSVGDDLVVTVQANDNVLVDSIEFFIDGSQIFPDRFALNEWRYPIPPHWVGMHELTAIATDFSQLTGQSLPVPFTVRRELYSRELAAYNDPPTPIREIFSREFVAFYDDTPRPRECYSREFSVLYESNPEE